MMTEKKPWDANVERASVKAMARFLRALVMTGSHFTCSFHLGKKDFDWTTTLFFRVWVPEGEEARFVELSGSELTTPPRISANPGLG